MDTEYAMSCAQELGEVTPLEAAVLELSGSVYSRLRRAVDSNTALGTNYIANLCREETQNLSSDKQFIAGVVAAAEASRVITANVERLEHIVFTQARTDLRGAPPNESFFELLTGSREQTPFFSVDCPVSEEAVRRLLSEKAPDLIDRMKLDVEVMLGAINALNNEGAATLLLRNLTREVHEKATCLSWVKSNTTKGQLSSALAATRGGPAYLKSTLSEKLKSAAIKAARKSIKKTVKLFQCYEKREALLKFLDGEEVELSHPSSKLKFVIRAPAEQANWLINKSRQDYGAHTPYNLRLFTKENVYIASMCVYFGGTPVLDQLLAMSLFVESGEEERIIEKANFFAHKISVLKSVAHISPAIQAKVQKHESLAKSVKAGNVKKSSNWLREHAWWEATYKPQVKQWVTAWLEDSARGLLWVASQSHTVKERILAVTGEAIPLGILYKFQEEGALPLEQVLHICRLTKTSGAAAVLTYLEGPVERGRPEDVALALSLSYSPAGA